MRIPGRVGLGRLLLLVILTAGFPLAMPVPASIGVEAGTLAATPSGAVVRNEQVALTGVLPPPRARAVTLERRLDGGSWSAVRTQTSRSDGGFTFTVHAPTASVSRVDYRVTAPSITISGTTHPPVETPVVDLELVPQSGWVDSPIRVHRSTVHTLTSRFHPAHPGRPVVLQRESAPGSWQQVASSVQSADGTTTFTRPTTTLGYTTYRAVAQPYRGAARVATNSQRVRVIADGDVAPPPVPGAPTATATGGATQLSWEPVEASDLNGYRVYRGVTAEGPWTRLTPWAVRGTQYVDESTADPVRAWFAVTSIDALGNESARSPAVRPSDLDTSPPGAPTALRAEAGDGAAHLRWDGSNAPDLAGYFVYRSADGQDPWTRVGGLVANAELTVDDLENAVTHHFRVTAVDTSDNESSASDSVEVTPRDQSPPPVPTGVTASSGDRRIHLDWDDVEAPDLASYSVYRGASADGPWDLWVPGIADSEYLQPGLVNGETYWFAVTSVDEDGNESARSAVVERTPADDVPPPVPGEMDFYPTDGGVKVSWGAGVSEDLVGFHVYRADDPGGPWVRLNDEPVLGPYDATGLVNGTPYWFRVTSVDANGNESAPNEPESATPLDNVAPAQVHDVSVEERDGELLISWTAVEDEDLTGYHVLRGESSSGPWTQMNFEPTSETDYRDTDVENGTTYWYVVHARDDADNFSPVSQAASGTPGDRTPPPVPEGLSADAGNRQVTLAWSAVAAADLASYRIYRSLNSGPFVALPGTVTATSHVDTGLFNDNQYTYAVASIDQHGNESARSEPASARPTLPVVNEIEPGISAGTASTCRLKPDGILRCWGYASQDRLPTQVHGVRPWTTVSVGEYHQCAVQETGSIWCWGFDGTGALGLDASTSETYPRQVGTATDWATVSAGTDHTCALRLDGTAWCWGWNRSGEVGDGTATMRTTPVQIGSDADWATITAGHSHTCATKTDGTAWCWGSGYLTGSSYDQRSTPVQVGAEDTWAELDAGGSHTCGVREDRSAWCWGSDGVSTTMAPTRVGSALWADIDAGTSSTCGVQEDGTAWCWGDNQHGHLGDGTLTARAAPVQIGNDADWSAIDAGEHHACGTRTGGASYCWGEHKDGELGDGRKNVVYAPTAAGSGEDFTQVVGGGNHGCGLRQDGSAWCWGYNGNRQLGSEPLPWRQETVRVGTHEDWTDLAAGYNHTCGVRENGSAWCWGDDTEDQVPGDTFNNYSAVPLPVSESTDWADLSTAYNHTCGLRADGTIWCWGDGTNGVLGNGGTSNAESPVQVGDGTDWVAVEAGFHSSCGLKSDGSAWCWGLNLYGQLGDGTTATRSTPVQVTGDADWVSIAVGALHTCGVREDGTAWCWGSNFSGELGNDTGNGTNAGRTTPVRVGDDADWTSISAGVNHTCGTRTGGTGWCWGERYLGTIGAGAPPPGQSGSGAAPVTRVPGDWAFIEAAHQWTIALATDGAVWGWGNNAQGQTGRLPIQRTPVEVPMPG